MIERIEKIEKLAEALGGAEFYEFHDAEIVSVKFDRRENVVCEVTLRIDRAIAEFEIAGAKFDRSKNFDAVFRFSGVRLAELDGFNHQNVIEFLKIGPAENKFAVHFKQIFGGDLQFECEKMELLGVEIFETEKKRFVPDIEKIKASLTALRKSEKSKH